MKIQAAMLVDGLYIMGITSVVKRYCKYINQEQIELTLLAGAPIDAHCRQEIESYGIKVVPLPERKKKPLKFYYALHKTLKAANFDILHIHGNSVNLTVELFIARLAGIQHRIFHCHNTVCNRPTVHKLLLPWFKKLCTDGFACGELAGDWIFGKGNFTVIPNGFEVEQFRFDEKKRQAVRSKYGWEDKFVIGHVGVFNYQKNQEYLIEIFQEVQKTRPDAVLLLVGDGPDIQKVRNKAKDNPNIFFYGTTDDTPAVYSAMDVFVFPSRFEGLPVVLLEAQMTGLPCVVSDMITREVDFGKLRWHSIQADAKDWVEDINASNVSIQERKDYFRHYQKRIDQYDIRKNAVQLERKYQSINHEKQIR